jgi:hypothetical protein
MYQLHRSCLPAAAADYFKITIIITSMKKSLLIPILLLASMLCHSQYIYKIKADSVLITNDSCNAELKAMIKENDSVYVFGGDTPGSPESSQNEMI